MPHQTGPPSCSLPLTGGQQGAHDFNSQQETAMKMIALAAIMAATTVAAQDAATDPRTAEFQALADQVLTNYRILAMEGLCPGGDPRIADAALPAAINAITRAALYSYGGDSEAAQPQVGATVQRLGIAQQDVLRTIRAPDALAVCKAFFGL